MSNMRFYDALRTTPKEALREITNGKLKGKSDINPMHRLEQLTKLFGPIGIGWNYKVTRMEAMPIEATNEIMCFVDIELRYKDGDSWSEPVYGTGGSMLVENYRNAGLKSNDDGFKMALTDAISVACKQLGMSADVYWAAGETKYNRNEPENAQAETKNKQQEPQKAKPDRKGRIQALCDHHKISMEMFAAILKELQNDGKVSRAHTSKMSDADFGAMLSLAHAALQQTIKESA